jgi:hypothetical protein
MTAAKPVEDREHRRESRVLAADPKIEGTPNQLRRRDGQSLVPVPAATVPAAADHAGITPVLSSPVIASPVLSSPVLSSPVLASPGAAVPRTASRTVASPVAAVPVAADFLHQSGRTTVAAGRVDAHGLEHAA